MVVLWFWTALQPEGSRDLSMKSLHVLPMSEWVPPTNPSFLPQSKDMHLRIGGNRKMDITTTTTNDDGADNNNNNNNVGRESNYGYLETCVPKSINQGQGS